MTDEPIKFRKFNCPHCDKAVLTNALAIAPYTCPHCSERITELPPQEQCEAILDEKGLDTPIAISVVSSMPNPVVGSSEGIQDPIATGLYIIAATIIFIGFILPSFLLPRGTDPSFFYYFAILFSGLSIAATGRIIAYLKRIAEAVEKTNRDK